MGEPYQKAGTPKIVNVEHTQGQFMIYRDGATPAVGHVADAVGGERDRVVAALGFEPRPMGPFYEQIQAAEWVHDPCEVGPPTMQHRYLTEDIPYALVPMTYFGDLIQVPTPVSDAVVQISAAANQEDYWTTGLKFYILLSPNTTHMVSVALIVAEYVSTVEHYDPGIVGVVLKSCGGPIAQIIPKGNLFTYNRT